MESSSCFVNQFFHNGLTKKLKSDVHKDSIRIILLI
ncbi:MAG: hypothetical protein Harvfovirus35_11 [Harvfovirus sp.]|uniref:Uncharacterized protein n=1 Tax=Harvfovirus sp. TaxID=2487768 RepID=A0A3G5A2M6_9VIRU|nr:MAG: hypothetical protein Harvfovirus35_11 [Harvfovirus sp.]